MDNTIYFLRGDHLGSSSVVLDNAGGVYARRTYYPYGETRTQQGSALPTDFTFTGQRYDTGELMDYGAREYDIVHAQFIQPDSIVPDPLDPQSLNRYSYGLNNPVKYTDPTGHAAEPACQSWDSWCWENRYWTAQGKCYSDNSGGWTRACAPTINDPEMLEEISEDNPDVLQRDDLQGVMGRMVRLARNAREAGYTDLSILAMLSNFASAHTQNDASRFMRAMSTLILGWTGPGVGLCPLTNCPHDQEFWLTFDFFRDTGFRSDFQDGSNQVSHFWFYAEVAFNNLGPIWDPVSAYWGNVLHETAIRNNPLGPISLGDLELGYWGSVVGSNLKLGLMQPTEVSRWIIATLGLSSTR